MFEFHEAAENGRKLKIIFMSEKKLNQSETYGVCVSGSSENRRKSKILLMQEKMK